MSQPRKVSLPARSVVLSTLLGTRPPVLPVRVLVQAGELFGISEGSVRTALSRMLAAGEVEADDGSYRLAGRLLERQARQEASRTARTRAWRREEWRFCFVSGSAGRRSPGDRGELRALMGRLRMAELREGVWLRPDNLVWSPGPVVEAQCLSAVGRLESAVDAGALWDLDGWAARGEELRRGLAESSPGLDDPAALAP
ncbi:MAG TPA: hypothetical protein VGO92_08595, partial [Acidimicrobiales bacterium]|nr:hypothetical protein [Acidimicrobiales bacterium]